MSKRTIVFCAGLFVALVPFLGLPQSWDTFLFVAVGLLLALVVWIPTGRSGAHRGTMDTVAETSHEATFVENRPPRDEAERTPGDVPDNTQVRQTARFRTPRPATGRKPSSLVRSALPRRPRASRRTPDPIPSNTS